MYNSSPTYLTHAVLCIAPYRLLPDLLCASLLCTTFPRPLSSIAREAMPVIGPFVTRSSLRCLLRVAYRSLPVTHRIFKLSGGVEHGTGYRRSLTEVKKSKVKVTSQGHNAENGLMVELSPVNDH